MIKATATSKMLVRLEYLREGGTATGRNIDEDCATLPGVTILYQQTNTGIIRKTDGSNFNSKTDGPLDSYESHAEIRPTEYRNRC
jgi:hypothetical protein